MKNASFFILFFLLKSFFCFSQDFTDFESLRQKTIVSHQIPFYDSLHLEQLDTTNFFLEKVTYGKKLLSLIIIPKSERSIKIEYHRIDDEKFTYIKKQNSDILERGIITYGTAINSPDTIITFDPETFEKFYEISYNHPLKKIESWVETNSDGKKITGWYEDGLKHGIWCLWRFYNLNIRCHAIGHGR